MDKSYTDLDSTTEQRELAVWSFAGDLVFRTTDGKSVTLDRSGVALLIADAAIWLGDDE